MTYSQPSARVLLDSAHPDGVTRLTTMELTFHRFVLAEWNTYRNEVARNSASSRAIPFQKMATHVETDPAVPVSWPHEQPGMQGGQPVKGLNQHEALLVWLNARDEAVLAARRLHYLGVHKSVCNRLLEPFAWHVAIFTGTNRFWEHAFRQRCSSMAQPEIRVSAEAAREAYRASTPQAIKHGEWHLPLVTGYDFGEIMRWQLDQHGNHPQAIEAAKQISAARCARVSYLTHSGKRDWEADLDLFLRLRNPNPDDPDEPQHASPWEQVVTPVPKEDLYILANVTWANPPWVLGPFTGWSCFRHEVEAQPRT